MHRRRSLDWPIRVIGVISDVSTENKESASSRLGAGGPANHLPSLETTPGDGQPPEHMGLERGRTSRAAGRDTPSNGAFGGGDDGESSLDESRPTEVRRGG
jgi:hypothetical protein